MGLTERGTEGKALMKGFEDRKEDLDGYRALLALQQHFDVRTTASMLAA